MTNTYAATECLISYVVTQTISILIALQCNLSEQQKKRMNQIRTSYGRGRQQKQLQNNYRASVTLPIRNDILLDENVQVHFYKIDEMLTLWLKSKDNCNRLKEFHQKPITAGQFNSIKNSEIFRDIAIHSGEPVIPLGLYCDEVLPLQALYARNANYKLYNFYIVILIEGPNQRKLEQVFPLCLLYTKDVGEVGLKVLTEAIVSRLRDVVSNGITYNGDHYQVRFFMVIGDNLSQNQLCGITRSWTSGKSCRYCHFRMADLATPKSVQDMAPAEPRTSEEYIDVIAAEANDLMLPYGFTHVPALHRIPWFPMNTTTFSLDLHHDFFLGCAVTWMTIITNRIVFDLQWISASSMKSLWKRFKFRGHDSKNRPYFKFDMAKKTVRICNKVAHVRTFILLFSTVLYPVIGNTADPVWVFYLQVLYLSRLLLTLNHTNETLEEMEETIVTTLTLRMSLTRTADGQYDPKIKYKEHNLCHYPRAIRLAGPLSLQSSSLCEQFHQFVKRAFGNSRCTKNVLYTILRRIDLKLHARSQAIIEPRKVSRLTSEEDLPHEALTFYRGYRAAQCLQTVEHNGYMLHLNSVYGLPNIDGEPDGRFFRILGIAQSDSDIIILSKKLTALPIKELGIFKVESTSSVQRQLLVPSLVLLQDYHICNESNRLNAISLRNLDLT